MHCAYLALAALLLAALGTGQVGHAERVSVLDFGAKGDGVVDDTAAIQKALDAAKGADGTADGRSVFSLYFPSVPGGFYKVTDSLRIDGTHGLVLYGDGALTRRGDEQATIRWYGTQSKPVFWVKGGTGIPSNPNFQITFRDLTISGYRTSLPQEGTPPRDIALSGIHFGNLVGHPDNTLCRRAIVENVAISNCRFGIWSGNPDGLNTDHATVLILGCLLYGNAQAGIRWGTGNAIVNVISCDVFCNGWAGGAYPPDAYCGSQVGANVHLESGYMDILSYTSAGRPTSADIYQSSGRISIINAWSDVFGYFFYQASASQNEGGYHNGQITGVRHYCGGMTEADTPNSMRIAAPGMVVTSCLVYGNIEVMSGLGGRPVFAGINFIRPGATYIGSGVDTQRSLTVLGNAGNNGQILLGGANKGVALTHRGTTPPQILSMGDNPVLFQVLGASAGDTGLSFHARTDDANGSSSLLVNGYVTERGVRPLQADKMVWLLDFGGSQGFRVRGYDPAGSSEEVAFESFVDYGGFRVAPVTGHRSEVAFQPPRRSGPPSFTSDDYWLGCIYFDTTRGKLRLNTGGSTWVDLN